MKHFLAGQSGAIQEAARRLQAGELVVYPTDTLYGLGAYPFDATAVTQLFAAKQRPLNKGIPILLADHEDIDRFARDVSSTAAALIDQYWPGPLTLILPRRPDLLPQLSPNDGIAIRIPDSVVARTFIRAAGGAVATTSANRSGEPTPGDALEAGAALAPWVTAVLDDGPPPQAIASTIVDCTISPPQIVRPGPVTLDLKLVHG